MVRDIQAKGGSLSLEDLRSYHASFEDPLSFAYRDARFHVTPYMTAGPTFRDAFEVLSERFEPRGAPDAESFSAYAAALQAAYEKRFESMGDHGEPATAPGCTTHFSVVDRNGNMVTQTQTLLSIFGARTVSPSTGLLMNNGIMWFDPVQGRPNSLGPGKRCLMNICPVLGEHGDRRFALGASGGRKIVSAVAQLSSLMVDHGLSLEESFHHPRIDVSGLDQVVADETLDPGILEALRKTYEVVTARRTAFPFAFACPSAVMREGNQNMGCTEIMSAWADSISETK
ncbi:gamma-glutamyltransferase [Fodinicurvata halophila]|uniref:gamma-glutamyltransferase n=1 Tax=Fodinicurvata halophila TaxID=1419723 RepID=UPI003638B2D2